MVNADTGFANSAVLRGTTPGEQRNCGYILQHELWVTCLNCIPNLAQPQVQYSNDPIASQGRARELVLPIIGRV